MVPVFFPDWAGNNAETVRQVAGIVINEENFVISRRGLPQGVFLGLLHADTNDFFKTVGIMLFNVFAPLCSKIRIAGTDDGQVETAVT